MGKMGAGTILGQNRGNKENLENEKGRGKKENSVLSANGNAMRIGIDIKKKELEQACLRHLI
ncbi:MAG: hypothetical protein ACHQ0Y_12275 [Thermodesulfovibrionales bacterium]